jgi:AAA+ ATPase superfamily predicted ATPase
MTGGFVGRGAELALLDKRLSRVRTSGEGAALSIRGRRQVGKSRLVQEFCDRSGVPYFFYTAVKGASPVDAVAGLIRDLAESRLPRDPAVVPTLSGGSWSDAFRILAASLPDEPSIIVLDELPWLAEQDSVFDGELQTAWDRLLSRRKVLLLLLGSDLHMMERLVAYDRPFYGRADGLVLGPLNPAEVGNALGLAGADAVEAHLISGGLPGILRSWPHGTPPQDFLRDECADPAAALFSIPESSLLAEFPSPDQARRVLEAVGSGDRTFANVAATAGNPQGALSSGVLSPLLRRLVEEKRVLAMDAPLSTQPGKPALYRIADSNLRLYMAMLRSAQEQSRRGRPEAAYKLMQRRWEGWRGRAVEPLVREALELAAIDERIPWPGVQAVGGWWNRRFDPEIDLVGVDRAPVAREVQFVGSIKWLVTPFTVADLAELQAGAREVPGYRPGGTGTVVVSLSGVEKAGGMDVVWGADDVVAAWRL